MESNFQEPNNSLLASWTPSSNTSKKRYGIVCFNGRVNRLNIINSVSLISNLTNLVYLDLSKNHISGTIPQQIGSLAKLQILRIFDNHLNGSIPEQIGYLRSLTKSLGMNFSWFHSASLGNLSNFSFCCFMKITLRLYSEEIGHLRSLSILHLSNNSLNGSIPASLGKLKNLSILILFIITFTHYSRGN
ncbi:hypothetical protein H5410_029690, partial [Solanum commersonii]